jgi:cell division protein FtsI (penicillin-binding protein 3)
VGAIKIALRLGEDRFYKYIRAFGFGQQTGIELPGETRGLTKPVNRWSKVSIGAISMGQEIGISPIQLAALVSTFANDGVWEAPRIVATTTPPLNTPQTFVFRPEHERRVISAMTAAQMRQMMRAVVLHGTGRKAVLEGYTSAGKTGTAQKVDPATGAYSRTKYVGSFAGFAPINNPAVTVAVILDSAVGLHQGGQVAAPVFQRVTQQVLEYLHVPHDMQLPPNRQVWLAQNKVRDSDLDESSPDHLGSSLELADAGPVDSAPAPAAPPQAAKPSAAQGAVVPAALRTKETAPPAPSPVSPPASMVADPAKPPSNETVVLDVEQGGIEVPSFIGKSVRSSLELAQDSGLELNLIGSGLAREQSPAPGTHVTAGSRVVVKFGR